MAAAGTAFEYVVPVREFPSYRGQRHFPGRWWSATDDRHVGYESWLERDHLVAMDFDPVVVGIASQPFWLSWNVGDGRARLHGPVERRAARDVAAFDATRRACGLLGWEYRLVGALDPIVTANLRWLAGYRHPRHGIPGLTAALRIAFAEAAPLLAGAEAVGDPIGVLPVLFHLLWRHDLAADLSVPLHSTTAVTSLVAP